MTSTYDFSKKYVLVTGSTLGIGRAIAELFIKAGATVAVHGRTKEKVEKVAQELNELKKGRAVVVVGDLSKPADVKAIIEQTDKHGNVDILVNNAAWYELGTLETQKDDNFRGMFEANVLSVFSLARHYLPRLLKKKDGRIVNISSVVGLSPFPTVVGYSVTKSALDGLTRNLAALTAGTKVTVTSVQVGPTMTDGFLSFPPEVIKQFQDQLPSMSHLGRFATSNEVAEVVAFLASDAGLLVNGASQRCDGGLLKQF